MLHLKLFINFLLDKLEFTGWPPAEQLRLWKSFGVKLALINGGIMSSVTLENWNLFNSFRNKQYPFVH